MDHVDARHHLEQFTDDVLRRAVAGRRHVDSARIGLGIGDELRDCLGRNRWMHHHHISYPRDAADRCDVSHEIEAEICVERGVDRIRGANLQKRIAIGGCLHDRLGGDSAGSARSVLDYELLAQPVRQPLSHQACRDVGGSASRKADDNADRPRRIGLRPCYPRHGRERGGARGQM